MSALLLRSQPARHEYWMRQDEIERIFRNEAGRVLATLIRLVGDFELAEEALQDAFAAALEQWSSAPENPRAWLVNVGRHKAVDRIRRDARFRAKRRDLETDAVIEEQSGPQDADDTGFGDDMLRLVFTCCHPALAMEARVALTLRAICGLSTQAVARAFLVSEDAMAQRLVRAKGKIRAARIPYETPSPDLLDDRLEGVLAVIYLVFSEGYAGTSGVSLTRQDLIREAIRLGQLVGELLPERPASAGLLSLMLLHDARRAARTTPDGDIILLEDQDRSLWDYDQIDKGLALIDV